MVTFNISLVTYQSLVFRLHWFLKLNFPVLKCEDRLFTTAIKSISLS